MTDTPSTPAAGKKKPAPRKRAPRSRKKPEAAVAGAETAAPAAPATETAPAPAAAPAAPLSAAVAAVPTPLIKVPLSVRWRDLDAFNHVNNSKYLSYLEEARLRWMMTLPGHGMDDHVAPVVAAAHLNYRRPIEWPNEVDIELFVERLGTTSVTVGHRIVGAQDPTALYCDGNVVVVWIHRETGQAAALPEAVRTACNS